MIKTPLTPYNNYLIQNIYAEVEDTLLKLGFRPDSIKIKHKTIEVFFPPQGEDFYKKLLTDLIDNVSKKYNYTPEYSFKGNLLIATLHKRR